jgi:hypothetical protein
MPVREGMRGGRARIAARSRRARRRAPRNNHYEGVARAGEAPKRALCQRRGGGRAVALAHALGGAGGYCGRVGVCVCVSAGAGRGESLVARSAEANVDKIAVDVVARAGT